MQHLKAYLESKSKMYIFSLTNTNQNRVVLSLCLVFLNAHVNAPISSLNFRQYSLCYKMQECAFLEKWRHKWNLVTITMFSEYCKADALGCNGYRLRNTGEFPSYEITALCKGKGRKWSNWIRINIIWLILWGNTT